MKSKGYTFQATLEKETNLTVNLHVFGVQGVRKSTLFTSSSLHKHKRKYIS